MKDRLKHIRLTLGYSQLQFAEMLGIEVSTYRGYEYKTKNLPNGLLIRLIDVFNVNMGYLLTGSYPVFGNNYNNTLKLKQNDKIKSCLKSFPKRYNKILAVNNLTDYEFSKLTGISERRLEKLGLGIVEPTLEDINHIKAHVDVNSDWLLYGHDDNYKDKRNYIPETNGLSNEELSLLRKIIQKNKHLFE